jgi:type IV pilus assembly protein PilF
MQRRTAPLFLVLVLGLVAAVPHVTAQQRVDPLIENTDDPLELQQLAVQFIRGNQPRAALDALRKAISIYPDNAETHMWAGVVYTQLKEYEAGEQEFERALEINPDLSEARNWYGVHLTERGLYERAIEQYRRALDDPVYPRLSRARVLVNLGNLLLRSGDVEAAIPPLSEAVRSGVASNDPLYSLAHQALGEALIKNGRPEEALGALESLEVLPPDPRTEYLVALAYRDLGETNQARDHLQRVLRLAPGTALADEALQILRALTPEQQH